MVFSCLTLQEVVGTFSSTCAAVLVFGGIPVSGCALLRHLPANRSRREKGPSSSGPDRRFLKLPQRQGDESRVYGSHFT